MKVPTLVRGWPSQNWGSVMWVMPAAAIFS